MFYSSQGLGVPTGPHGVFRDYQVDAITMEFSLTKIARHSDFLLRAGRYIILCVVVYIYEMYL